MPEFLEIEKIYLPIKKRKRKKSCYSSYCITYCHVFEKYLYLMQQLWKLSYDYLFSTIKKKDVIWFEIEIQYLQWTMRNILNCGGVYRLEKCIQYYWLETREMWSNMDCVFMSKKLPWWKMSICKKIYIVASSEGWDLASMIPGAPLRGYVLVGSVWEHEAQPAKQQELNQHWNAIIVSYQDITHALARS